MGATPGMTLKYWNGDWVEQFDEYFHIRVWLAEKKV